MLTYDGILNAEELIECINTLNKYFDYDDVNEAKKVKFFLTRMREHASIWWDGVKADR